MKSAPTRHPHRCEKRNHQHFRVESPIDVTIHSTAGMLQYEERVTSDRMIDVRALGTGVHVVKAGSSTTKILTK